MDFTYWFPWKYAGVRFQGAGLSIGSGNGSQTREVTVVRGFAPVTVTGAGNNVAAGVLTGDFMLRLPLDDFWPGVHLAPYFFAGLGGIILGSGGEGMMGRSSIVLTPIPCFQISALRDSGFAAAIRVVSTIQSI
jgi:hypothetical protein